MRATFVSFPFYYFITFLSLGFTPYVVDLLTSLGVLSFSIGVEAALLTVRVVDSFCLGAMRILKFLLFFLVGG